MFFCVVQGMKLASFPTKFMMIFLYWEKFSELKIVAGSQWGFGSGFSIWHYFGRIASCTISRGGSVFLSTTLLVLGNRCFSFFFELWLSAIIGPDWNGVQETCFFCISVPGVSEYLQLEVYFLAPENSLSRRSRACVPIEVRYTCWRYF